MPEQLTLYTAKICPWAHRVEIALAEAEIPFTRFEVDLANKPEWYAPKVNPASKVPAIAYSGPATAPDHPSPESQKIAESQVLLEFVADISGKLLPKDPVLRARARFFIDTVTNKFAPAFQAVVWRGENPEILYSAVEALQSQILGKFAVGDDYSIADAAFIPFVARLEIALKNDIGAFQPGVGVDTYAYLFTNERFAKFTQYVSDVESRDSFIKTTDEEYIIHKYRERAAKAKEAKA